MKLDRSVGHIESALPQTRIDDILYLLITNLHNRATSIANSEGRSFMLATVPAGDECVQRFNFVHEAIIDQSFKGSIDRRRCEVVYVR